MLEQRELQKLEVTRGFKTLSGIELAAKIKEYFRQFSGAAQTKKEELNFDIDSLLAEIRCEYGLPKEEIVKPLVEATLTEDLP